MTTSRRILLVEDEPTLQRILGSVLTDAGHVVETVATAEAALERLLHTGLPELDLVLSDKNLPAMNGLDLLAAARAQADDDGPGFILVTGYPSRDSAITVLGQGGDGYLVKPFRSLVHAIQAIEQFLATARPTRGARRALARAVGDAVRSAAALPAGVAVAVIVDDDAVRARLEGLLTRGGATLVAPTALVEGTGPRALFAGRVEDLLAHRKAHPDTALVLVDGAASFNALVDLINAGGGALLDPVHIPGGAA